MKNIIVVTTGFGNKFNKRIIKKTNHKIISIDNYSIGKSYCVKKIEIY